MNIDASTITLSGSIATIASGLFLLTYWLQQRREWIAFWWSISLCVMGVGIGLIAFNAANEHPVAGVLGAYLLDMCAYLTWIAARIFNRRVVRPIPALAGLAALAAVQTAGGALLERPVAAAIGVGISACFFMVSALEFWRARGEVLRGRTTMITVLVIYGISILMMSIYLATESVDGTLPPVGLMGAIHFAGLIYAVGVAMSVVTMLRERSEASHKAAALIDPLTGLANRRAFLDRAARMLLRGLSGEQPVSILALDLDRFKNINDTFGHSTGDRVLRIFSDALSRSLRPADLGARIGGEEFVALLAGSSAEAATAIAERIRRTFEDDARFVDGHRVGATVSIGVAMAAEHHWNLDDMLASADAALYDAKHAGRNRVVLAGRDRDRPSPARITRIA